MDNFDGAKEFGSLCAQGIMSVIRNRQNANKNDWFSALMVASEIAKIIDPDSPRMSGSDWGYWKSAVKSNLENMVNEGFAKRQLFNGTHYYCLMADFPALH